MESSSPPSTGEDPNVCLRFSLGPTNLGILRPHLDIMKEHPVVIEQRDFRFDVYGRPADVANAIAYSFLSPTKNADPVPQGTSAVLADLASPPSMPDVNKWKTDYDLAWERFFGPRNNTQQEATESLEPKSWSVTILLSMPFRVIQYLMLTSHGFKTYLVEEPNLDACTRQGVSQERIKLIAEQARMVVAINNVQLPSIDSNPEESPVWLQLGDRKALRAVLLGVCKALEQEPVRGVIQMGLGQSELELRKTWDGILGQTITSGTTPREWVMDDRTSREENVQPPASVTWVESPTEARRVQGDRRQAEQDWHHVTARITSPNRIAEHRRISERDAWNNRLTEEWDGWDSGARSQRDTPSVVVRDPWMATTSQSVGSFFTESGHNGAESLVDGVMGPSTSNSSLSEDSQGNGRRCRSTSSQEAREPRHHDDSNSNNNTEDP
ncbi:hypothetical protein BGX30_008869 [Mortierella sp. GBA39]|nr:hypothetical protein BGX30_008869 [Mortierella sp. GBA39]